VAGAALLHVAVSEDWRTCWPAAFLANLASSVSPLRVVPAVIAAIFVLRYTCKFATQHIEAQGTETCTGRARTL